MMIGPYKTVDSIERRRYKPQTDWVLQGVRVQCPDCGQPVGIERLTPKDGEDVAGPIFKLRPHQDKGDRSGCSSHYRVKIDASLVPLYGMEGWYDSDEYEAEREASKRRRGATQ